MRGAMVGVAAAMLLAGCGGGAGGGPFAGLDEYDAGTHAARALHDAEADPATSVHGRTLAVAGMSRGRNSEGGEAWVVRLETLGGKRIGTCLFVWGHQGLMQDEAIYDVAPCPAAE